MKSSNVFIAFIISLFLAIPALAQSRQKPGNGQPIFGAGRIPVGAPGRPAPSIAPTQPVSPAQPRVATTNTNKSTSSVASVPGRVYRPAPIIVYDYRLFRLFEWMQYRYSYFGNTSWDYDRCLRNREPLINPRMAQMALQEPLQLSRNLLAEVNALQQMADDFQNGKPMDQKEVEARTSKIRTFAKQIREHEGIIFFDAYRKGRQISDLDQEIGLGAIAKLHDLAQDMNSQLTQLSEQKNTSTVSVSYWSQNSFRSLSKGIEKLSKQIENTKLSL
jgi:hypothetical protein